MWLIWTVYERVGERSSESKSKNYIVKSVFLLELIIIIIFKVKYFGTHPTKCHWNRNASSAMRCVHPMGFGVDLAMGCWALWVAYWGNVDCPKLQLQLQLQSLRWRRLLWACQWLGNSCRERLACESKSLTYLQNEIFNGKLNWMPILKRN